MIAASAINVTYAEALLTATPPEQLADNRPHKLKPAVTPEQMAKLEREMDKVQGQYQQVEQTYGADLLHLTVAKGYLARLLANAGVRRYINQHQPEILAEFQLIVDTAAIDEAAAELLAAQDGQDEPTDEEAEEDYEAAPIGMPETVAPQTGAIIVPFEEAA